MDNFLFGNLPAVGEVFTTRLRDPVDKLQSLLNIATIISTLKSSIDEMSQICANIGSNSQSRNSLIQELGQKTAIFHGLRHEAFLQIISGVFNTGAKTSCLPKYTKMDTSISFRELCKGTPIEHESLDLRPDLFIKYDTDCKTYTGMCSVVEVKVTDSNRTDSDYNDQIMRYKTALETNKECLNYPLFLIVIQILGNDIRIRNYIQKFSTRQRISCFPDLSFRTELHYTDFNEIFHSLLAADDQYLDLFQSLCATCYDFKSLKYSHNYNNTIQFQHGYKLGPMMDNDLLMHKDSIKQLVDNCSIQMVNNKPQATIYDLFGQLPTNVLVYTILNMILEHKGPQNYFDKKKELLEFIESLNIKMAENGYSTKVSDAFKTFGIDFRIVLHALSYNDSRAEQYYRMMRDVRNNIETTNLNNASDSITDFENMVNYEATSKSDVIKSYTKLEECVLSQNMKKIVHVNETKPSRHFLLTDTSNHDFSKCKNRVLMPTIRGFMLDIEALKKYGVYYESDKEMIPVGKKSHVNNSYKSNLLYQQIEKDVEKISTALYFNKEIACDGTFIIERSELHDNPDIIAETVRKHGLFYYDKKIKNGLQGVMALLKHYFSVTSDYQKHATAGIIIDRLFRQKKEADELQMTNAEIIADKKKMKKERGKLFSNMPGYESYTGYTNSLKLPKDTPVEEKKNEHINSKLNLFFETMGKDKKIKDKTKLRDSINDFVAVSQHLQDETDKMRELADQLQTKKQVLHPTCQKCIELCDKIEETTLNRDSEHNHVKEILDTLSDYYLCPEQVPENKLISGDKDLGSIIKENIHSSNGHPMFQTLYSTQTLFDKLLVKMNVMSSKKDYCMLYTDEEGRFFLVPPSTDTDMDNTTYLDIKIGCCSDIRKISSLFLLNSDNTMLQYFKDNVYIMVSKPIKLNSVRVEALSKLYYRFFLCMSGFSVDQRNFCYNIEALNNCLSVASNITMSKLGLFDLARHQFNHCISTCSKFTEFMSKKFDYDNKTISDFLMYRNIKNWLIHITETKELLLNEDSSEVDETNVMATTARHFKSYITGQNYLSFQDMINNVFGPVYFSLKSLHGPHNLYMLEEVPPKFEIDLMNYFSQKRTVQAQNHCTDYFVPPIFQGETEFSHDAILLMSSQTNMDRKLTPHIIRQGATKNMKLDSPISEINTAVSSKASVQIVEKDYKKCVAFYFNAAYKAVIDRGNGYTAAKMIKIIQANVGKFNRIDYDMKPHSEQITNLIKKLKTHYITKMHSLTKRIRIHVLPSDLDKYSVDLESMLNFSTTLKQVDLREVDFFELILTMDDYILARTMPVKSALYNMIKANNYDTKVSTFREILFELLDERYLESHVPTFTMFEKHQRTKVDREIYIADLLTKYILYPIEMTYFTLNTHDDKEAISVQGDKKKKYLQNLEMRTELARSRLSTLKPEDETVYHVERFNISVDQSKWSALDSFPKFLISVLNLHFLGIKDRLVFLQILLRYMGKRIVVDDDVMRKIHNELSLSGFTPSKIYQITNHLQSNQMYIKYNWFQGIFNHMSSKIHSYAIFALQNALNNYLLKLSGNAENQCYIDAMVHSDDGAIGVVFKLEEKIYNDIFINHGSLQSFFMNVLIRHLRKFGIILNPTKTFFHPTILDFISDYIINKAPMGTYMRALGTILAPLDHQSYYLDMKQISGSLQNIAKNVPSVLQMVSACYIASQFVHSTYNLNTERMLKALNDFKEQLHLERLPLVLFGPVSMPLNLIAATGLSANDPYLLLKKIALDIKKQLPNNKAIVKMLQEYNNCNHDSFTHNEILNFLVTDNNFTKIPDGIQYSPELQTMCFFVNSNIIESDSNALDMLSSNNHLLKVPNRKKEISSMRRVPHLKDVIDSIESTSGYFKQLSQTIRYMYQALDKDQHDLTIFMNNMRAAALKPKTYSNLSNYSTTKTRINIKTDINNGYFTVDQILSSIDTNTVSLTVSNDLSVSLEDTLLQQFTTLGSRLLSIKDKILKNRHERGLFLANIDKDEIYDVIAINSRLNVDIPIANKFLNDFREAYYKVHDKTNKLNLHASIHLVIQLACYIKTRIENEEINLINLTMKNMFYSNISMLNYIAYSQTCVPTSQIIPEKPSLVAIHSDRNLITLANNLERQLYMSITRGEKFTIRIKDEAYDLNLDDICSMFGISSFLNSLKNLSHSVKENTATDLQIMMFHYYFDIIYKVFKQYFTTIKTATNHMYLKVDSRNTSEIISILKGSFSSNRNVVMYRTARLFRPNNDYGLMRFIEKFPSELNYSVLENNLHELNHHIRNLVALAIAKNSSDIKLRGIKLNNVMSDLKDIIRPVLNLEIYPNITLDYIYKNPEWQILLSKLTDYWLPLGYNMGFLNEKAPAIESFNRNTRVEEWPDSETGKHTVIFSKQNVRVIVPFDGVKMYLPGVKIYSTTTITPYNAKKEAKELIRRILDSKNNKKFNFYKETVSHSNPMIDTDFIVFNKGNVVGVTRDNITVDTKYAKFIQGPVINANTIRRIKTGKLGFFEIEPLHAMQEEFISLDKLNSFSPLNLYTSDGEHPVIVKRSTYKPSSFNTLNLETHKQLPVFGFLYYKFISNHRHVGISNVFKTITYQFILDYYTQIQLTDPRPIGIFNKFRYTGEEITHAGAIIPYNACLVLDKPVETYKLLFSGYGNHWKKALYTAIIGVMQAGFRDFILTEQFWSSEEITDVVCDAVDKAIQLTKDFLKIVSIDEEVAISIPHVMRTVFTNIYKVFYDSV